MTIFATTTTRDVIRVSGPDAAKFLQGQISQDVDALAVNTSTWTFLLAPAGKVDAWMRITKVAADAFMFDLDAGHGEAVATRLTRFKIRTDAVIDANSQPCVAVRGVSVRGSDATLGEVPDGTFRLPLARVGHAGYDLVGPGAVVPDGIDVGTADDLLADRIAHGVPAMGAELTEATIPAEVGQWIIDESVSFTKGCFVGQELVARIDSRGGNVPRHLRVVEATTPMQVGDDVLVYGASVGTITSAAADAPIGLAYIARKVEVGAGATIGASPVTLRDPVIDPS